MVKLYIENAEKNLLNMLINACKETFSVVFLPSHNHIHHLRVWTQAKKILLAINNDSHPFSQQSVNSLLVASLFHDQGLSITLDEKHGIAGCEICKAFFKNHKELVETLDLPEILTLIEKHENKNYDIHTASPYSLLTILAVADDIDAFGVMGIYRYAEIYLMRNIPYSELADKVLLNASHRFNQIEHLYSKFEPWFSETQMNFHILEVFYQDLQSCLKYNNSRKSWTIEVLDIISHKIIEKHAAPLEIAKYYKQHHPERLVKEYFRLFYKELLIEV